jgi:hypothetical protein
LIIKKNEQFFKSLSIEGGTNGVVEKPRSRIVANPVNKGLGCFANANLIDLAKQIEPVAFIHALNPSQLQERIFHQYSRIQEPRLMAWDGASHDAHQHIELMTAVDNQFCELFFNQAFQHSGIAQPFVDIIKRSC